MNLSEKFRLQLAATVVQRLRPVAGFRTEICSPASRMWVVNGEQIATEYVSAGIARFTHHELYAGKTIVVLLAYGDSSPDSSARTGAPAGT